LFPNAVLLKSAFGNFFALENPVSDLYFAWPDRDRIFSNEIFFCFRTLKENIIFFHAMVLPLDKWYALLLMGTTGCSALLLSVRWSTCAGASQGSSGYGPRRCGCCCPPPNMAALEVQITARWLTLKSVWTASGLNMESSAASSVEGYNAEVREGANPDWQVVGMCVCGG
jgi:hypothetical protein